MLENKCLKTKDLSFDIKKKELAPKLRNLIGDRVFKKKFLDNKYFVINYRSKII